MTQQIWLNLPVKDIAQSKAFFSAVGFSFNEQHSTPDSACLVVGEKKSVVMLFKETTFAHICRAEVADARKGAEVMISFDAQSREEVDEITRKAREAGANVFGEPSEIQGWMYGSAFADLDGHRWNVLFMDMSKAGK